MAHEMLSKMMSDDEMSRRGKQSALDRATEYVRALGEAGNDLREEDPEVFALVESWLAEVNPPAWVADEDIWARAKEAVDPEGEGAGYVTPWAVVVSVYRRMGGRVL